MSRNRKYYVGGGLILMLGLSFIFMQFLAGQKPEPPRKPEVETKRYVKTQKVAYGELTSSVKAPGRVLASNGVMLVAEASGRIEAGEVALKKGASFRKGQKLLNIYKDEAELLLKSKKSTFLNAVANLLPDIKIDFANQYDAFRTFFSSINLNTDLPELPQAALAGDEKLRIFLASRNVLADYYSIKKDEMALKRYTIYAPFDGSYSQVNFEVGAYVNMGTQLGKMISTGNLEIEVPVNNTESGWINLGDKVRISSGGRDITWGGTVIRKSNFVEEQTQSRSLFVRVERQKATTILTGEYLNVEFHGQTIQNVMEMPRSAVSNGNDVFTVVDNKLNKATINIVKINDQSVIFNGLDEGTELVIEPLINVKEQTVVETFQ